MSGGEVVSVNLGETKVSTDPVATMVCFGLGSCVGLAAYDPKARVAGLVHVVLPVRGEDQRQAKPDSSALLGRFADTAVPHLIALMEAQGASRRYLTVKLAGGAQMFAFPGSGLWEIGQRNIAAVREALAAAGLRPAAEDVGGGSGRTLRLSVGNGRVTVSAVGRGEREL